MIYWRWKSVMVCVERSRLISTPRNLSQLYLDVLDALLRLADDMAVIHIGRHNHLPSSAVLPDVHTRLTARLPEANLLHHLTEREIPLPPSLLEAIERLEEQAIGQASIWSTARSPLGVSCRSPPQGRHSGKQW
jgi:hypothetical protein